MIFEIKNVHSAVNAEDCELFTYGYFANDIASIKQTMKNKKEKLRRKNVMSGRALVVFNYEEM